MKMSGRVTLVLLLAVILAAPPLVAVRPASAEGNVTQEWFDAGFDEYDASHWMTAGFDFAASKAWRDAGFNYSAAHLWKKRGFTLEEAKAWKAAGVKSSKKAAKLRKQGVTPETYQP